jgi:hypothetical protein
MVVVVIAVVVVVVEVVMVVVVAAMLKARQLQCLHLCHSYSLLVPRIILSSVYATLRRACLLQRRTQYDKHVAACFKIMLKSLRVFSSDRFSKSSIRYKGCMFEHVVVVITGIIPLTCIVTQWAVCWDFTGVQTTLQGTQTGGCSPRNK